MNVALSQFAEKADSSLASANDIQKQRIQTVGLPEDLESIFTENWLKDYGQIEALEIYDIQSICEELEGQYMKNVPEGGYFPIGKAPNGDLLVVDFKRGAYPVGFIQLAEWNVDHAPDEKSFVEIAESIEDFIQSAIKKRNLWERLTGGRNLPCDSYDI